MSSLSFESCLIWYFTLINLVYVFLLFFASFVIYNRNKELKLDNATTILKSNFLPGITFIIPAYNERKEIFQAIQHVLQLSYRHKQLIIVNDGSTDDMLKFLQKKLRLIEIPKFYNESLKTATVKALYRSQKYKQVLVIDKEHLGKFDAINAGINACSDPFFIINDADTLIDNQSFEYLIRPFLTHPETIAVGASVRIKNGCDFHFTKISAHSFPQKFLPGMQALEYLRAFLMRVGWNVFQGSFIISGAFSLFAKEIVIKITPVAYKESLTS